LKVRVYFRRRHVKTTVFQDDKNDVFNHLDICDTIFEGSRHGLYKDHGCGFAVQAEKGANKPMPGLTAFGKREVEVAINGFT